MTTIRRRQQQRKSGKVTLSKCQKRADAEEGEVEKKKKKKRHEHDDGQKDPLSVAGNPSEREQPPATPILIVRSELPQGN